MASVVSDSVQPHRWHPTRLPHPQDSPGKNPGVDCHFLLQCMKVKSEGEVAQLCPTLRDPLDCSLPGSSVHGILQARGLELGASAFSGQQKRRHKINVKLGQYTKTVPLVAKNLEIWFCFSSQSMKRVKHNHLPN